MPQGPRGQRLRTYLKWAAWVSVAFFAVYPTMNWITSMRSGPLHLYLASELAIPFVPELIWAYLSLYVLFLLPPLFIPAARMPALGKQLIMGTAASAIVFLLLPAELGFARTLPESTQYAGLYAAIFSVDRPYNLVPSLHVVFSAAIAMACADFARPRVRAVLFAWIGIVAASTVLVHQHHLIDVAAAFLLVWWLRRRYKVVQCSDTSSSAAS
jgi:membrane-associated phospholipid phosphatase